MNTITISESTLEVEPQGLDKLWSFTQKLVVPLAHVVAATFDPDANDKPIGLRAPGLSIPGKWAGTFHHDGDRAFWNVSAPGETVVIELTKEHYTRLVLTVGNPRDTVDAVNAAASA